MRVGVVTQQPNEILDYDFDASGVFNGDSDEIASVAVSVAPSGLTVSGVIATTTTAKVWASGGTNGTTYVVTVTITSDSGRVKEDEFVVKIKEIT